MLSVLLLPLLALSGVANAQNVVTVASNDTSVIVTQDGQVLSQTYLESPALTAAGLFTECDGTLVLNNTIDSTASLTFNGTSITVTFITCNTGGEAALYIDGNFWENVNTYTDLDVTVCTIGRATNVNLPETPHTITITNSTPNNRTHIQSFEYTPYVYVPPSGPASTTGNPVQPGQPTSTGTGTPPNGTSANSSNSSSKHSSTGAIAGGVVAGILVLLIAIFLVVYFMRKRDNNAATTTTNNIQPSAWQRPVLTGTGMDGAPHEPKDYMTTASYNPATAPYNMPVPASAAPPPPAPFQAPAQPMPFAMPVAPSTVESYDRDPRRNSITAASTLSSPYTSSTPNNLPPQNVLRTVANPGPRPLPDAPSPAYSESVGSGSDRQTQPLVAPSLALGQHRASQLDTVQQLLARGVPASEITTVIRMMNERDASGAGPSVAPVESEPLSPPPPEYGDEKAGLRGL